MATLDAGQIDEARGAAMSAPPGKSELGHRLEPTFGDGASAIGDAAAALQHRADRLVRLEALKFLERREKRIFVIEVDDEPTDARFSP